MMSTKYENTRSTKSKSKKIETNARPKNMEVNHIKEAKDLNETKANRKYPVPSSFSQNKPRMETKTRPLKHWYS